MCSERCVADFQRQVLLQAMIYILVSVVAACAGSVSLCASYSSLKVRLTPTTHCLEPEMHLQMMAGASASDKDARITAKLVLLNPLPSYQHSLRMHFDHCSDHVGRDPRLCPACRLRLHHTYLDMDWPVRCHMSHASCTYALKLDAWHSKAAAVSFLGRYVAHRKIRRHANDCELLHLGGIAELSSVYASKSSVTESAPAGLQSVNNNAPAQGVP